MQQVHKQNQNQEDNTLIIGTAIETAEDLDRMEEKIAKEGITINVKMVEIKVLDLVQEVQAQVQTQVQVE